MLDTTNRRASPDAGTQLQTCGVLVRGGDGRECAADAVARVTHTQRPLTFCVCAAHVDRFRASPFWAVAS